MIKRAHKANRPMRRANEWTGISGEEIHVLAVDDDVTYLAYIANLLSRLGLHVSTATNGHDAIEDLRKSDFDLILCDLQMPKKDGFQTIQEIRSDEQLKNIYSILITGHEDADTKILALNTGCDDFLPKSSSEKEIIAKVKAALRIMRAQRALREQNSQLYALAITDELTAIPNRRYFISQAQHLIESGNRPLTLLLFDLDGFKRVNDEFGHRNGDRVLRDVAEVLNALTRHEDTIARYGGDEFAMLTTITQDEARAIAERICSEIRELRWTMEGREVRIGITIGIAGTETHPNTTYSELFAIADEQLYALKASKALLPAEPSENNRRHEQK